MPGRPSRSHRGVDFAGVWSTASDVPGWLTARQAERLWQETCRLPAEAHVVEIGSHQGRSTLVLAGALAQVGSGRLTAVDPFVEGRRYGGASARAALEHNLESIGLRRLVTIVESRSQDLRPGWDEPIDLLWIDGKHDYGSCADDLRWSRHLPEGGRLLVHDAFSSIGVTTCLLLHVLPSRRLRLVRVDGSLATLEVSPPRWADRLRLLGHLPWWCRNILVKVLLRLRLGSVARLLGHHDEADPY